MDDEQVSSFWGSIGKLFRQKPDPTMADLIEAAHHDGSLIGEDAAMLLNILKLGDKEVAEIMIPRPDIVCSDIEDGIEAARDLIVEHGHSRIPVYEGTRDTILGVVYAKDLLRVCSKPKDPPEEIRGLLRKPLFIPETLNLRRMLLEFRAQKKHIAIALDEYGGTSGLVTLEDVLEEIVGEIEDEHDRSKPDEITALDDGSHLVSGRYPLEDLSRDLDLSLESDQVETIGGYLTALAGRVPRRGETFELEGRRFTVKEADRRQVRQILIEAAVPSPPGDEEPSAP